MKKKLISCLISSALLVSMTGSASASWISTIFETSASTEESTSEAETEEETEEETEPTADPTKATEEQTTPEETLPPEETTEEITTEAEEPTAEEQTTPEAQASTAPDPKTPFSPAAEPETETEPDYYNITYLQLIDAYKELLEKYNNLVLSTSGTAGQPSGQPQTLAPLETDAPVQFDLEEVKRYFSKGDFLMASELLMNTGKLSEEEQEIMNSLISQQIASAFRFSQGSEGSKIVMSDKGEAYTGFYPETGNVFLELERPFYSMYSSGTMTLADYEYGVIVLSDGSFIRVAAEGENTDIILEQGILEQITAEPEDPTLRLYNENGTYITELLKREEVKTFCDMADLYKAIQSLNP